MTAFVYNYAYYLFLSLPLSFFSLSLSIYIFNVYTIIYVHFGSYSVYYTRDGGGKIQFIPPLIINTTRDRKKLYIYIHTMGSLKREQRRGSKHFRKSRGVPNNTHVYYYIFIHTQRAERIDFITIGNEKSNDAHARFSLNLPYHRVCSA